MLLILRSLAGSGPVVGVPRVARVLIVAPHPDDESIGCGGTAALLAAAGTEVSLLVATDGEATQGSALDASRIGACRRSEVIRAAALLGIATPTFLGLPDGRLSERIESLATSLAKQIQRCRPDILFVPSPLEDHADHRAVNTALLRTTLPPRLEVWGYETSTPVPANRIIDVTAVLAKKEAALDAHATAKLAFDISAILGLNRYRSIHGLMGRGWAEGFLSGSAPDYVGLVRTINERS